MTSDERFDKALRRLDAPALAREIKRRLDKAVEGTRIEFRCGSGYPPAAGVVTHGRGDARHAELAQDAAAALIGYQCGDRYRVVRHYKDAYPNRRTLRRDLSLYEAQQHCSDPETSSSTCKSGAGRARTCRLGPWFDGYSQD